MSTAQRVEEGLADLLQSTAKVRALEQSAAEAQQGLDDAEEALALAQSRRDEAHAVAESSRSALTRARGLAKSAPARYEELLASWRSSTANRPALARLAQIRAERGHAAFVDSLEVLALSYEPDVSTEGLSGLRAMREPVAGEEVDAADRLRVLPAVAADGDAGSSAGSKGKGVPGRK